MQAPNSSLALLPPLREIIAKHGLSARKGLGQNFILDLNLTRKIARAAGDLTGVNVIEVGPGPGGLTRAILESPAASLTVIELDSRAIAIMQELKSYAEGRLNIIEGDALEFNYQIIGAPRVIIANLPYHVATPLLIGWLRQIASFKSITIMLQKEVAQRLVAQPRTPAYGRLAVMCQWLCDVKLLFDVPPSAFVPPPKVTSAIVQLTPKGQSMETNFEQMEKTVALAFSQRRKMLKSILNASGYDGENIMQQIGVHITARAEELTAGQFIQLAKTLPLF